MPTFRNTSNFIYSL